MVSTRRVLRFAALFAVVAAVAQGIGSYWVFEIHGDRPFSSVDDGVLTIVFWPQRIAALMGWPGGSSVLSFVFGCVGWGFIGALVGAIWRRRGVQNTSSI
jgi:hypothetical protein